MQRASATNTPSRVSTPASEPQLKRRKTDHTTTPDSSDPPTPLTDSRIYADRQDIRAATKAQALTDALAAERRALQGFANNTIETQWVLDVDIPAAQNGTADVDGMSEDEEEEDEWSEPNGRQTYGSFKPKKKGATSTATIPIASKKDPDAYLDGLLYSGDDNDYGSDDLDSDTGVSKSKKRKAGVADYDDDAALDRVDLSKSSYAKSKKAGLPFTGAKPGNKQAFGKARDGRDHPRDRRGDRHPKKGKRGDKGKKK